MLHMKCKYKAQTTNIEIMTVQIWEAVGVRYWLFEKVRFELIYKERSESELQMFGEREFPRVWAAIRSLSQDVTPFQITVFGSKSVFLIRCSAVSPVISTDLGLKKFKL